MPFMENTENITIVPNARKDASVIKALEPYNIKKAKTFRGHDGDGYLMGSLYKKSKVIAHYAQDAWGGSMIIEVENKELHDEFVALLKTFPYEPSGFAEDKYFQHDEETLVDYMIGDVITERQLKAKCRNKWLIITESCGSNESYNYPKKYNLDSCIKHLEKQGEKVVEVINHRFK